MSQQRARQISTAKSGVRRAPAQVAPPSRRLEHPMLRLQRTIGNRAVQRMIASQNANSPTAEGYEREFATPLPTADAVISGLSTPGRPLDEDVRNFMEARFGFDFGSVRIRTDPLAAELSEAINAKAYTIGQDIAFGAAQYSPSSSEGQKLIAHELTHVVQLASGAGATPPPGGVLSLSDPSDALEQAADAAAEQVVAGGLPKLSPGATGSSTPTTVRRDGDSDDDPSAGALSSALDFGSSVADAFGQKGLGGVLGGASKGLDAGGAAAGGDMLGAASPVLDVAGEVADALGFGGVAAVAKGASSGLDLGTAFGKGDTLEEAKSVTSAVSGAAGVGGFDGALGMAGPAAAVAGAGLAGMSVGNAMAKLADSNYTKTGAFGVDPDSGKNRSAMDWGANWGTHWDKARNNTDPSIMGAIVAGAGGIAGGIGGAAYGAANWLCDKI
jgi:hypothetical protein